MTRTKGGRPDPMCEEEEFGSRERGEGEDEGEDEGKAEGEGTQCGRRVGGLLGVARGVRRCVGVEGPAVAEPAWARNGIALARIGGLARVTGAAIGRQASDG